MPMKLDTLETAKRFVESLQDILKNDPVVSGWLFPLEPLLQPSYRNRFRIHQGQAQYLIYDDNFYEGQTWLNSKEYYKRSEKKIRDILKLDEIISDEIISDDIISDNTSTGAC